MANRLKPKVQAPIAATLSILVIISVGLIMYGLTHIEIPAENKDLFNMGFGSILTWGGAAIHYFLGSSKGSKDKTAAMAAELAEDGA